MSVFDLLEGVYTRLRGLGPPSHGAKLLAEFGIEKSAGPLLDLGSGSGDQSVLLAGEGRKNIHLVDVSEAALHRARSHPALHRTIARAEALPYKDSSFQGIFLIDVLHHVSDQEAALREIFRVLAPAGVVLIVEYHRSNPIIRIFFLLSLLRGKRCSFLFPSGLLAQARRTGLQGAIVDSDGLRFTARLQKTYHPESEIRALRSPLPRETVSQSTVRPSTSSGRTGKWLDFRVSTSVRGEPVEP